MGDSADIELSRLVWSTPSLSSLTAWSFVVVGTLLPVIISRELLNGQPEWLVPAQLFLLFGLLVMTVVSDRLRSLRVFALVLLFVRLDLLLDWSVVNRFLGVTITNGFWIWSLDRSRFCSRPGSLP